MIHIKRGTNPGYERLWSLQWRGVSIFGNTSPFGFFAGPDDARLIVCLAHVGVRQLAICVAWKYRRWVWPRPSQERHHD